MGQALPLNLCQRGRDEGITNIEEQEGIDNSEKS